MAWNYIPLDRMFIGDDHVKSRLSFWLQSPRLARSLELQLQRNWLRRCVTLVETIEERLPRLRILNLADNSIDNLSALAGWLESNPPLMQLDLSQNSIEEVEPMARALSYNTNLLSLNLAQNRIQYVGCLLAVLADHRNTTLEGLFLAWNRGCTDAVEQEVLQLMIRNSTMNHNRRRFANVSRERIK